VAAYFVTGKYIPPQAVCLECSEAWQGVGREDRTINVMPLDGTQKVLKKGGGC
jgi:hypothetical protein